MFSGVAISEAARSDLYTGLRDVLGPERAATLMSAIPLHDLDEVATKRDIAELRAELKVDMAQLRVDVTNEIDTLRRSMTGWVLMLVVANIGAVASVALIV